VKALCSSFVSALSLTVLSKTAVRIPALAAMAAQPAMSQFDDICAHDFLTGKNSRQEHIEDSGFMIHYASRKPQHRYLPDIGEHEHGARQHGGTVCHNTSSGGPDPC